MKIKTKYLHIAIIILGIIFISLSAFHTNLWFDESYSVGIAKHSLIDIWKITGNDVHPALYYWVLHIIYLIFGNNIIAFRLFSVLGIALLGIIGYTHIKKDFGEKCGIIFSFLTYFLPVMLSYAIEIRMYTWGCLVATLCAIYAYRFYINVREKDNKGKLKNLCIFGITSICSCYIHYFGVLTAGIINLFLLIYLIKNRKQSKKDLISFLCLAGLQVLLYAPWLIYLIGQIEHVHNGYWIEINMLKTPIEVISFQFRTPGTDIGFEFDTSMAIGLIVSILLYIYLGIRTYKCKKEKIEIKPALLSFGTYYGVILISLVVSLIIWRPVLATRYLMIMTGIFIIGFSYVLSKENNRVVLLVISTVFIVITTINNINYIDMNYYKENTTTYEYIKNQVQKDDIFVYTHVGVGGVMAARFPENKQYFLCHSSWDVKDAYVAYAPAMEVRYDNEDGSRDWSFLDGFTGRVWLIDADYMGMYDEFPKDNTRVLKDTIKSETKYHDYVFSVKLIEIY